MAVFKPYKVTALPGSPVADAVYFVKGGSDTKYKIYVTSSTGVATEIDAVNSTDLAAAMLTTLKTTGDQTKTSGVLTFAVSPVAPTPTTASQVAIKSYVDAGDTALQTQIDNISAVASGIQPPTDLNCSSNPNYPASAKGVSYLVTGAGRIGGASGPVVEVGDMIVCKASSAAGTHAAVGANFFIVQGNTNIVGTDGKIARFGTGNTVVDSIMSESGSRVTVAGNIKAVTSEITAGLEFHNGSIPRWSFSRTGTESGSNSGSVLTLLRFNDAGGVIDTPFSIDRASGVATFYKVTEGISPTASNHLATKGYVDSISGSANWQSTDW